MSEQTAAELKESETEVALSVERRLVALECTWEIEVLCKQLRIVVTPNEDQEHLVVRGISARIEDLARIVMSALGDELETTTDLAARLRRAA